MPERFKIICLECGSEDVDIREEIEYDYYEVPYSTGSYLYCFNCGSISD